MHITLALYSMHLPQQRKMIIIATFMPHYSFFLYQDMEKTREVYKACLDLIPHKKFTFAKMWVLMAQFEIRQKELQRARRIMVSIVAVINLLKTSPKETLAGVYGKCVS